MSNEKKYHLHNLKALHMSAPDKARMREFLLEYADLNPVPEPKNTFIVSSFMMSRAFSMTATLALILVVSGAGATLAAEGSMPGDAFYSIKIGVSEPLMTALATSDEKKARVASTLAIRRVNEVAVLASSGKLSDEKQAELEASFDEHVQVVVEHAAALAEHGDVKGAEAVKQEFTTSLAGEVSLASSIDGRASERTKTFIRKVIALSTETDDSDTSGESALHAKEHTLSAVATATSTENGKDGDIVPVFKPRALRVSSTTELTTMLRTATPILFKGDRAISDTSSEDQEDEFDTLFFGEGSLR